jgi:hypothetical protein
MEKKQENDFTQVLITLMKDLLIPLHSVTLDQLLVIHLDKKLMFYELQRLIIMFTKAHQWILSCVTSDWFTNYFIESSGL